MDRIECTVHGFVQGVGFRWFTRNVARKKKVKGKVWNNKDGSVTVKAEASKKTLNAFLNELKKGGYFGNVHKIETKWKKGKNEFTDFTIDWSKGWF